MSFPQRIDFASLMEPVAARLLGDSNKRLSKPPKDVRYGNHGSLSVDLTAGRFFNHENNVGGGVLDLVRHQLGLDHSEAISWMRCEGFIPDGQASRPVPPSSPPTPPRLQVVGEKAVPPITAAYDYIDEDGVLLFQVVRYEPKNFRQRRPNGRDGWDWNVNGIRRVLYRLPELIQRSENATVLICEGEKDTDNVRALGFVATTNAGGAGKWRSEYNATLRGADVVLVPHNDDAGRHHAEQVAAGLYGIAGRIRVLDLAEHWQECPHKGDVSDWIAAGGTTDALATIIETLSDWSTSSQNSQFAASPWPDMEPEAFYGLAGEVVKTIEPHSEADPNGVLLQFLAAFGNAIGTASHFLVEGDQHRAKIFVITSGATSKGRKGTAMGRVRQIMELADSNWATGSIQSGLSSGEGVIYAVRDAVQKVAKDLAVETVDEGVTDKRLMLITEEFVGALSVMERPGNTLSPVLRDAWGTARLQTLTKNSPTKATGSHISIIAHTTDEELRARLTRIEMANGFANRFMFAKVRRSKLLPHGGHLDEQALAQLGNAVAVALENAKTIGRLTMSGDARTEWERVYPVLSGERPGLLGAVLGRAEAQVIRLAVIYSALDNSTVIDTPHLEAALAVWDFCEASATQIFGDLVGDAVADTIMDALKAARPNGLTRTEISALFQRHVNSSRISTALDLLRRLGRARRDAVLSGRHKVETWFAATGEGS
jgi:hypothetical protein